MAAQAATTVLALFWLLIAAGLLLLARRAIAPQWRRAAPGFAAVLRRRPLGAAAGTKPDDRE
jgi:hypothetical protein